MDSIDFVKVSALGTVTLEKNEAVTYFQERGLNYSINYLPMMFNDNEIYDSSVIKILSSFKECGIKKLFKTLSNAFDKEKVPYLVDFNTSLISGKGTHTMYSLLKYIYRNSNTKVIYEYTFKYDTLNSDCKIYLRNILKKSIEKRNFSGENLKLLTRALKDFYGTQKTVKRAESIIQDLYIEKVKEFVIYKNINKKNQNSSLEMFHYLITETRKIKGFDFCGCIRILNADMPTALRNNSLSKFKEILLKFNVNDITWEQDYVDLLMQIEFGTDIYCNISSSIAEIAHKLPDKNAYLIDEEKLVIYVRENIISEINKEYHDIKDRKKGCFGTFYIALEGNTWTNKCLVALSKLSELQNPCGIILLKTMLNYIIEKNIPIEKGFYSGILHNLYLYKKINEDIWAVQKKLDDQRKELGIKWECLCLEIIKNLYSEKKETIFYQYVISPYARADIAINLESNNNGVPIFEKIYECKKSFYFAWYTDQDGSNKMLNLRQNSVVNKYQGHCKRLYFLILDDVDLQVDIDSKTEIISAKKWLAESKILQIHKEQIRQLKDESDKIEEETRYLSDKKIPASKYLLEGVSKDDSINYKEVLNLLSKMQLAEKITRSPNFK